MKFRRGIYIAMTVVSTAMIAAGSFMILLVSDGYQEGNRKYQEWREKYTAEPETDLPGKKKEQISPGKSFWEESFFEDGIPEDLPEEVPWPRKIDFDGLLAVNSDVVGWIELPATGISYPVVQAADNEYYLHMSLEKKALFAGSLFLDAKNDPGFSDENSIIYGHNMRDGSMFAKLQNYHDLTVYDECPYFWIYTADKDYLYQIYSVHKAAVGSAAFLRRFSSEEEYSEWAGKMREDSEINAFIDGTYMGKSVTLTTCTSNPQERQIVQGVCIASISHETKARNKVFMAENREVQR